MNHFLHGVARATSEAFELPGPILEIGSYQVAGQEDLADLRRLFPDKPYLGVDLRPGPGVDCLANVEALPQADASVGTVVAMNCFEHVARFWRGFDEIHRVLCADGVLLVSAPFYFHIHEYPNDYWRFSPAALEVLLEPYPTKIVGWHGPKGRPLHVWAVAFREGWPTVSAEQVENYRVLLGRYAREPLSRFKQLRFGLAAWLCGRGAVSPYLDQQCWEIVCRSRSPKSRTRMRRPTQIMTKPR
jgi:SAM-dependent methyltransferase